MISILLPVFQGETFLEETLQSVIQQDVEDWELVAVNDQSSDRSGDILRDYAGTDERIIVLDNTEKGLIPALQLAYRQARGKYITRMDQDDLMPVGKLRLLRDELLRLGPGHVASGKVRYFSDSVLGDGYRQYESWLNAALDRDDPWREIYRECVLPSPNWMVGREDLDEAGAFDSVVYPEDYDLTFRMYAAGLRLSVVDELTHLWRDHPARASRKLGRYADPTYFELKVKWWKELEYEPERPLALWGAGPKGKKLAAHLQQVNLPFYWVCDTPSKVGHHIKGLEMRAVNFLDTLEAPMLLIAVSSPAGRAEIQDWLTDRDMDLVKDYYFFC